MHMFKRLWISLLLLLVSGGVHALTIEVLQGEERPIAIAVVPFGGGDNLPENVSAIIAADLQRSGKFSTLSVQRMYGLPREPMAVDYAGWRNSTGVEFISVGSVELTADGHYSIRFWLLDAVRGTQLASYNVPATRLRTAAHQIADIIYEKIIGERGAFDTMVAYVTVEGGTRKTYRLAVADADGYNEQVILTSEQPLMSPAWSPGADRIAYVSFEKGRPVVYVQEVSTGRRRMVAGYDGINSAPAFSPDGNRLALHLTRDGNSEIYILDLLSNRLTRVTRNTAIDTEPNWSKDGNRLLFTSDRGGGPQIYQVNVTSSGAVSEPQRLTFGDSNYNARGSYSPDGKRITYISRINGAFRVVVQDLATGSVRELTDSRLDESPSFAPNGSMIIYATERSGRGVLEAVSVDGRAHQRLGLSRGAVREPAWSPFSN